MDSKLQPVQLYGFSKSRLYEPLGTAIFFRNRFCPVSWILLFLPVHFYGYSLHQGRPVSQEELMDHVWDNSVDSFSNSIRVHISALRKKLRAALGYDPIRNRIGEGYLMGGEEE